MTHGVLITGTERRRTFTDQEKRAIVAEAFAAGASPTDVARRLEIGTGLLYTWRKKALASAGEAGVCEPAFLPAVVADMAPRAPPAAHDLEPRRCAAIEIDFGAGVKVRIEAGVPKDVIAATLKALR